MRTLQLNVGYEPIGLISWKRAVKKIWKAKAEVLAVQSSPLRSHYSDGLKPAVIRIFSYHRNYGDVKLCRENIFARDQYLCQYCGEKFKKKEFLESIMITYDKGETDKGEYKLRGKAFNQVRVNLLNN